MSKKLENFIRDNKKAFDEYTPSDALWQNIEKKLEINKEASEGKSKVFVIKSWMKVAAVVTLLVTTAVVFYNLNRQDGQHPEITSVTETDSIPALVNTAPQTGTEGELPIENDSPHSQQAGADPKKEERATIPSKSIEEEELYHYVRLIEIKQGQMKELKKTEPELYKEFSKDAEMLETSYDALKTQLSKGVNSEKLLEAMIGNLKMQADLLNKQLEILKQVHKKKNIKDEKDYKNL